MAQPKLYFDHCYRVLPESAFEEIKSVLSFFPSAEYRKNKTNYGFWEGVYIHAKSGEYIEFIREDAYWKKHFVSMSISQFGEERDLHKQIVSAFPHHTFSLSECNRPDGSPWLLITMLEQAGLDVYFYAEEYREKERAKRKEKGKSDDNWLLTVDTQECHSTQAQLGAISKTNDWFSEKTTATENEVRIEIAKWQQEGHFQFIIHSKEDVDQGRPFYLTGKYDVSRIDIVKQLSNLRLKHFRFEFRSGQYVLEHVE
jgi:hypothetical protein